jgi:hypothetical protein
MTLRALLDAPRLDLAAIGAHLDALSPEARVTQTRAIDRRAQARLYEAAAGHRAIGLDDFVPADRAPLTEVRHHGRNSLPAFRTFAKVFTRPAAGATELWGYNDSGLVVNVFVGPGYFTVRPWTTPGEVVIDYTRFPGGRCEGWPEMLRNDQRLSRFVFYGTEDVMRGVSRHVTVGRARKAGRWLDNWFVLCRDG